MKRLYIVSGHYFDFDQKKPTIGGVQTYITDLVPIFKNNGFEKITIFVADKDLRSYECMDYKIVSYNLVEDKTFFENLARFVKDHIEEPDDLVLYDTDERLPSKFYFKNLVALQHGICWDIPYETRHSLARMVLARALKTYKRVLKYQYTKALVCVDYNFVNWYRTQVDCVKTKLFVIPNNTRIAPLLTKDNDKLNIMFARRLCWYRGTRVFLDAIKKILAEYSNITVTVAGDGPDEELMHKELDKYDNVNFIKYKSDESLQIHSDKHIAIVPTVGSEGTSLSLLEAMSAQCAVVATNVGGMTNIILDGYNGLFANAGDSQDLYVKIKRLLDNPELMKSIASKGYESVKMSFSHERWEADWNNAIYSIKKLLD